MKRPIKFAKVKPRGHIPTQHTGPRKFKRIWGLKSYYTTPRDKIAWLKAINRNLYVLRDEDCTAGKQHKERIFHIVKCGTIQRDLWKPLKEFMILNDIEVGDRLDLFFMFGNIRRNRYACPDAWGLILLAWRCIYAEITRSHKEGTACAPLPARWSWPEPDLQLTEGRIAAQVRKTLTLSGNC